MVCVRLVPWHLKQSKIDITLNKVKIKKNVKILKAAKVLKIYSKVNSIKKSKRTAYKKLKILRNYKVPIGTPLIYYI